MHCTLAIIGGHFLDVEKSENSYWSLKSVCIAYVTFIALLLVVESSTSFIKEHLKQFLCRFCVNVCFQIKLVERARAKRNGIKWQAEAKNNTILIQSLKENAKSSTLN